MYLLTHGLLQSKQKWTPDCVVMSWDAQAKFLKSRDLKDRDFFRDMANYNTGMMTSVYGLQFFVSNQLSGDRFWMFEKNNYAVATIRRDELIVNLEENRNQEQGLSISSRYGFAYRDAARVIQGTVAAPTA